MIGELGPAAAPATEALAKLLTAPKEETQTEAAFALAEIGPDAAAAVPALTQALKSEGPVRFVCELCVGADRQEGDEGQAGSVGSVEERRQYGVDQRLGSGTHSPGMPGLPGESTARA